MIMVTKGKLLTLIIGLILTFSVFSQEPEDLLKNLFVQDMVEPDSVVHFVLIEFECSDIPGLLKVEVSFNALNDELIGSYSLDIIHESGKHYIKLPNDEKIELRIPRLGFVLPVPEPSKQPYNNIEINAFLQNGEATNMLNWSGQIQF